MTDDSIGHSTTHTVSLSPAEVVPEVFGGGIEDHSAVKGGWVDDGGGWEEVGPVEDIA